MKCGDIRSLYVIMTPFKRSLIIGFVIGMMGIIVQLITSHVTSNDNHKVCLVFDRLQLDSIATSEYFCFLASSSGPIRPCFRDKQGWECFSD